MLFRSLPADLVPLAIDSVTLTSAARPWLDTTIRQTVQPNTPTVLPLVAADPQIAFIHGDYRGFLTPLSYAKRGDYLHFLIRARPELAFSPKPPPASGAKI